MTPYFTHDCTGCLYLTSTTFKPEHRYDFYFCPRCDGGSLIARYGDEDRMYTSGPWQIIEDQIIRAQVQGKWSLFADTLPLVNGLIQRSIRDRYRALFVRLQEEISLQKINLWKAHDTPIAKRYYFLQDRIDQIDHHYV